MSLFNISLFNEDNYLLVCVSTTTDIIFTFSTLLLSPNLLCPNVFHAKITNLKLLRQHVFEYLRKSYFIVFFFFYVLSRDINLYKKIHFSKNVHPKYLGNVPIFISSICLRTKFVLEATKKYFQPPRPHFRNACPKIMNQYLPVSILPYLKYWTVSHTSSIIFLLHTVKTSKLHTERPIELCNTVTLQHFFFFCLHLPML